METIKDQIATKQATTEQRNFKLKYDYAGISKLGYVQLIVDGRRAYGAGCIFNDGENSGLPNSLNQSPIHKTPLDRYQDETEVDVLCRCMKSGALYRFVGRIKFLNPAHLKSAESCDVLSPSDATTDRGDDQLLKSRKAPAQTEAKVTMPDRADAEFPLTIVENCSDREAAVGKSDDQPLEKKKTTRRVAGSVAAELDCIFSMRNAGMNPMLRVKHVCALLSLSRATVYRRVEEKQLPPPKKLGRATVWYLSQIETYLNEVQQRVGAA